MKHDMQSDRPVSELPRDAEAEHPLGEIKPSRLASVGSRATILAGVAVVGFLAIGGNGFSTVTVSIH